MHKKDSEGNFTLTEHTKISITIEGTLTLVDTVFREILHLICNLSLVDVY